MFVSHAQLMGTTKNNTCDFPSIDYRIEQMTPWFITWNELDENVKGVRSSLQFSLLTCRLLTLQLLADQDDGDKPHLKRSSEVYVCVCACVHACVCIKVLITNHN